MVKKYVNMPIVEAFSKERSIHRKNVSDHPLRFPAEWATYHCNDSGVFSAYIRWGRTDTVLANIHSPYTGEGKMGIILSAIESLANTTTVESVMNKRLAEYLLRNGYEKVEETNNYIKK